MDKFSRISKMLKNKSLKDAALAGAKAGAVSEMGSKTDADIERSKNDLKMNETGLLTDADRERIRSSLKDAHQEAKENTKLNKKMNRKFGE